MRKSFAKAGLFAMALAATSAFAEGTYDPNQPGSQYQDQSSTSSYYSGSGSSGSDVRNADSANWGVGAG
jgi:hypothetical protein